MQHYIVRRCLARLLAHLTCFACLQDGSLTFKRIAANDEYYKGKFRTRKPRGKPKGKPKVAWSDKIGTADYPTAALLAFRKTLPPAGRRVPDELQEALAAAFDKEDRLMEEESLAATASAESSA